MQNIKDFVNAITVKNFISVTLSKPRPYSPYTNILIRPVKIQSEIKYQVTYKTEMQDQVENIDMDMLKVNLHLWLVQNFFFGDLKTKNEDVRIMQSKKGKVTIQRKKAYNKEKDTSHDRKKNRIVSEDAPFLKALGLTSKSGNLYGHGQRKYKQINRYIELIKDLVKDDDIDDIVDMGSGKGYLTFALYEYFRKENPKIKIRGIEVRQDLVDKCNEIAKQSSYKGLTFYKGSIEDVKIDKADMVIALHACDIATDMAIAKGIKAKSKYIVVAPCCHKQIRKEMVKTNSVLNPLLTHGILKERQAEMITDTIRSLLLESKGYHTKVFEFIDTEHTPKNIMITGKYTGHKNSDTKNKIKALKSEFGIKSHYLEKLI